MIGAKAAVDRQRLARVLGMLGSTHDGEVLAAARLAEQLRARAGVTWTELLGAHPSDDPHGQIIRCLDHPELLTDWEIDFLHILRGFTEPTPKQRAILERIALKVRARD
jgi:hypothetical protein